MTLTEAGFWTKRFGVILGVSFVIFLIIAIILTVQSRQTMPPQYMTANYACTEYREDFLESELEISSLTLGSGTEMVFDLQTESGKIDSLPQIINVYEFDNPQQSLSAQAEAKTLANSLGFDPDTIIRKGTESYVWVDKEYDRTLEVLAKNQNFVMQTDTDYIKEIADEETLPSEQEAKSIAVNFLRNLNLLSSDYSSGVHSTMLININPDGTLSEASSLSEAELIRVDLQRSKSMITIASNLVGADQMVATLTEKLSEPETESVIVDDERLEVYTFNTPVTYLNPNESNISIYVGATDPNKKSTSADKNVYIVEYTNWPIETDACGTYELVSPSTAIEEVQNGNGSLVYLNEVDGDDVENYTPKVVKKFTILYVNLTYYESEKEQPYLQPVYVISGEAILENDVKANFDFYYPAINYDIVQDKIELEAPEVEEEAGISIL